MRSCVLLISVTVSVEVLIPGVVVGFTVVLVVLVVLVAGLPSVSLLVRSAVSSACEVSLTPASSSFSACRSTSVLSAAAAFSGACSGCRSSLSVRLAVSAAAWPMDSMMGSSLP